MIRIIKGTYGYWNGSYVERKTSDDKPFNDTPENEERLVNIGVAKYVNEAPEAYETELETENFEVTEEYLHSLSMKQLQEFAEQFGIKFKVGTKKADFIEEILTAMDKAAENDPKTEVLDDGEKPPVFDATEAVQ